MLLSHSDGYVLDIKDFMSWFPFCGFQDLPIVDGERSYLIELDPEREFTFLDVITWFLNDYTDRRPVKIAFDYLFGRTIICVFFHDCTVSFTFFDYE